MILRSPKTALLSIVIASALLLAPAHSQAAVGQACSTENNDPVCDPCNGEICHNFGTQQEPDLRCGTVQITGFVGQTPSFSFSFDPNTAAAQCPGGQLLNVVRNATQTTIDLPGCWNDCSPVLIDTNREADGYFDFLGVSCSANSTYCQEISGGADSSACRTGECTDNPLRDQGNPSGCEYQLVEESQNPDCALCSNADEIGIPACGNGICEGAEGEDCAICPIDCLLPDFQDVCPLTGGETIEDNCGDIRKVVFDNGPPYNNFFGECEDGDLCTDNQCSEDGLTCEATPKGCSGDTADFCCPATCVAADDVDCFVPEECASPSPTPSPTPTPTVLPVLINGAGCSLRPGL